MTLTKQKPRITVIGAGRCSDALAQQAEEVGTRIAKAGGILICGGLGGVMEAVARGAQQAGGITIGILPVYESQLANDYIDIPIPTGLGHARNAIVAASGDVVIAIGGEFGTLSELALALKLGKPVIGLKTWALPDESGIMKAQTAEEAVSMAFKVLEEKK